MLTTVASRVLPICSAILLATSTHADTPQVVAESQAIAVAISNLTPHMLNTPSFDSGDDDGFAGPGFPYSIWPYQNTGTGVVMRGGIASGGFVGRSYRIENGAATPPAFSLGFSADTEWDFDAAASLLLHQTKQYGVKKAKAEVAGPSPSSVAKKTGKAALVSTGAFDGMDEVLATLKVIKEFAKIFKALDPTFVMNIELSADSGSTLYDNSCVAKYQNTPGPANVQIVGPDETITQTNADEYFVVAAGSVNKLNPGFVDVTVSSLCDYVCANWNGTLDYLNEYSQSDCESATSGTTALTNYQAFVNQNTCLQQANLGPAGTAWVTPPDQAFARFVPPDQCGSTGNYGYLPEATSICGECPPVESQTALGSWSESCDETSFDGTTLCANCAGPGSTTRDIPSCQQCDTGHWSNDDGTLACADPPGSWSTTCDFDSFEGTTLCATCETDTSSIPDSSTCQACSSDEWSNINGQLVCAPAVQSASVERLVAPLDSLEVPPPLRFSEAWPQVASNTAQGIRLPSLGVSR
ncbi:CVNH domain-containing protein [Myxococcota bacterium]|nr:CVNH domain-containing protein [Myxococcota bacterium]